MLESLLSKLQPEHFNNPKYEQYCYESLHCNFHILEKEFNPEILSNLATDDFNQLSEAEKKQVLLMIMMSTNPKSKQCPKSIKLCIEICNLFSYENCLLTDVCNPYCFKCKKISRYMIDTYQMYILFANTIKKEIITDIVYEAVNMSHPNHIFIQRMYAVRRLSNKILNEEMTTILEKFSNKELSFIRSKDTKAEMKIKHEIAKNLVFYGNRNIFSETYPVIHLLKLDLYSEKFHRRITLFDYYYICDTLNKHLSTGAIEIDDLFTALLNLIWKSYLEVEKDFSIEKILPKSTEEERSKIVRYLSGINLDKNNCIRLKELDAKITNAGKICPEITKFVEIMSKSMDYLNLSLWSILINLLYYRKVRDMVKRYLKLYSKANEVDEKSIEDNVVKIEPFRFEPITTNQESVQTKSISYCKLCNLVLKEGRFRIRCDVGCRYTFHNLVGRNTLKRK